MAKRQLGKKLHLSGFLVFTAYSNDMKKINFCFKVYTFTSKVRLKIWLEFRNAWATILMKWHKFICLVQVWFFLTYSKRDFSLCEMCCWDHLQNNNTEENSEQERKKRNLPCLNVGILLCGRQDFLFLLWIQYNFWKLCLSDSIKYTYNGCYVLKCGTYRHVADFSLL